MFMEAFTRFTVFMIFMIFLIHGNSWFMKSGAEALRTAVVPRLMHAVQNASTRKAWIVSHAKEATAVPLLSDAKLLGTEGND